MTIVNARRIESRWQELASRLRHRVTLQQPSETPDGAGGVTRTWQDVATLWAEIEALSANESVEAARLVSGITHRITLRYRSGVTAQMRVSFDGRVFNIRSVTNLLERDIILEVLAEEGVAT